MCNLRTGYFVFVSEKESVRFGIRHGCDKITCNRDLNGDLLRLKMNKFKRIFIEISNVCNLSCSFCPPSKRSKQVMSVQDFETVLKKIEGRGDHIYLHVKGEPLFHPDFKEILDLCHQYNKIVNITTNGTLLGAYGEIILENPSVRLVNISLQSFEGDTDAAAYDTYLTKVLTFVKRGLAETSTIFDLRLWNFDDHHLVANEKNQQTLDRIESFLDLPNLKMITDPKTKKLKLNSKLFINKGVEFDWPSMDSELVGTKGNCFGLRHQLAILSNGVIVPCCLDADGVINLGNIFEDTLQDVVASPRASAIARGFENRNIVEPLCMKCSYRERIV